MKKKIQFVIIVYDDATMKNCRKDVLQPLFIKMEEDKNEKKCI